MVTPVDKEICDERHRYLKKSLDDLQSDVKDIKSAITDLTIQFKSKPDAGTAIRKALPWIIALVSLLGGGGVVITQSGSSAPAVDSSQQP